MIIMKVPNDKNNSLDLSGLWRISQPDPELSLPPPFFVVTGNPGTQEPSLIKIQSRCN